MQFVERTTDDTNKHLGSILIDVTALPNLAACLADLARYEGWAVSRSSNRTGGLTVFLTTESQGRELIRAEALRNVRTP